MKGKVYLVGAGPGDPELLTVKALRSAANRRCRFARRLGGAGNTEADSIDCSGSQRRQALREKENPASGDQLSDGRTGGFGTARCPAEGGRSVNFRTRWRRDRIPAQKQHSFRDRAGRDFSDGCSRCGSDSADASHASDALVFITAHRAKGMHTTDTDWSEFVGSGATLVIYMPGQNYPEIARR